MPKVIPDLYNARLVHNYGGETAVLPFHYILALDEPARELPSADMGKSDVPWERAEERNAGADQYGNARDDQALNEAGSKEALDRDAAVNVDVFDATASKLRNNIRGLSRYSLDDRATRNGRERARAEHEDGLFVRPCIKGQYGVKGIAANHQRIDSGHELVVSVWLPTAGRQKVQIAVDAGNEAVEACADEY